MWSPVTLCLIAHESGSLNASPPGQAAGAGVPRPPEPRHTEHRAGGQRPPRVKPQAGGTAPRALPPRHVRGE